MAVPRRVHVVVCACTYRRPAGLAALLEGLAAQTFKRLTSPKLSVIIVDNEGSDVAKALCDQFKLSSDIAMQYVHEPQRGISHARNASLDNIPTDCDFFAMIDDDEIPHPDWIEQLLLAQESTGADVVQGRVLPELPASTPDWIVRGSYFDWQIDADEARRAQQEPYPEVRKARTNNVLVRHAVVRELGLRFDPRFALTGGEDIVFFEAIMAAGHRVVFAPLACVRDIVPPERTTLRYLLRMWYRVGCNDRFKVIKRGKPKPSLKRMLVRRWRRTGSYAVLTGAALVIGNLLRGRVGLGHSAEGILLIARGLGRTAGSFGIRYEHYR